MGKWGFGGKAPDAAAILQPFFFQEICIFSLNFCLKTHFMWLNRVCWCAPKACSQCLCPLPHDMPLAITVEFYFIMFRQLKVTLDSEYYFEFDCIFSTEMKYYYYCFLISCWWRHYNKSKQMQWRPNVINDVTVS